MTGDPDPAIPSARPLLADDPEAQKKRDRRAKKVRSTWISFFGRIVAHVIGAAATVTLGLMIANQVRRSDRAEPAATQASELSPGAPRPRTDAVSIAVLPLDNFSGDAAQDYFADGMTEAVIADLTRIHALHVISRTSVMQYKHQRKPLPQIARELGVDVVIEGSVVLSGKRVRVTVQLVDAHDDRHLWAQTYDRDVHDVLELQSDVARSVAREVKVVLTPQEQARLSRSRPVDPAAIHRPRQDTSETSILSAGI